MRNAIVISIAFLAIGGCATGDEQKTHRQEGLRAVALPDLTRLEESVQAQLRERYAALTAKQSDPRTPDGDLATEYGEMGKLLLAAELLDPAEAALLNAQALAVIPGTTFGIEDKCLLRIAYGALQKETAAEGIGRLADGLKKIMH